MSDDIDWDAFDSSAYWREDGPFDYDEVDLDGDDVHRLDLGALIITPRPGMELRLQVREGTNEIMTVLCLAESAESALELSLYGAPRAGKYWSEVRDIIAEETASADGQTEFVKGLFGTEIRRLVPAQMPDGQEAVQPSRMFAVEGDRWLLRGVLLGQAALVTGEEEPAGDLLDMFRDTIVRRGEDAMAPGELIALTMPDSVD